MTRELYLEIDNNSQEVPQNQNAADSNPQGPKQLDKVSGGPAEEVLK